MFPLPLAATQPQKHKIYIFIRDNICKKGGILNINLANMSQMTVFLMCCCLVAFVGNLRSHQGGLPGLLMDLL